MDEVIKNKEYILAHQDEFKAAVKKARELYSDFPGIVRIGMGQKNSAGKYLDNISIIVTVVAKKEEALLDKAYLLPKYLDGFPLDVVVLISGQNISCENSTSYDNIKGGIQICPESNSNSFAKGTLACIVRKRNNSSRENVYILSNKHVMYAFNSKEGSYIYHPFPPGAGESTTLGPIISGAINDNVGYKPEGSELIEQFHIDCAIAQLHLDSKCFWSTCTKDTLHYEESIVDLDLNNSNRISDVRSIIGDITILGKKVFKVGRTTGKTVGFVREIDAPLPLRSNPNDNTSPFVTALNLIRIEFDAGSTANHLNCKGNAFFADEGDSGSLLLDEKNRAIGLINANSHDANSSTYACHILPILDQLSICIPTHSIDALPEIVGTSHGSSRATDGSGIAPLPSSGAGGGAIGLEAIFQVPILQSITNEIPADPEPLTEAHQARLTMLLQKLRSTNEGIALHESFAIIRREIGFLVRNCRPVKVAWQRNKGPAFFAAFLNHLKGDRDDIPAEVGEITLSALLDKMEVVLKQNGSKKLVETLNFYGISFKQLILSSNNVESLITDLTNSNKA